MVRNTLLKLGIETDLRGAQAPIFVSDRTAGVLHMIQSHLAVGMHIDIPGKSAAVAVHELKESLVEIGAAGGFVAAGGAAHPQSRVEKIDLAFDGQLIGVV